jgi:hypothetical protein
VAVQVSSIPDRAAMREYSSCLTHSQKTIRKSALLLPRSSMALDLRTTVSRPKLELMLDPRAVALRCRESEVRQEDKGVKVSTEILVDTYISNYSQIVHW